MSFAITSDPIDAAALRMAVARRAGGAFVAFEGWIRDHNEGHAVERLEYEIYAPLALSEGEKIIAEARERFDILAAACVHRQGLLEIGETAVLAVATAAHRDEAFRACRYIIDAVKHRLPIWKKEHYADGEARWVNCRNCGAHAGEAGGG